MHLISKKTEMEILTGKDSLVENEHIMTFTYHLDCTADMMSPSFSVHEHNEQAKININFVD